MLYSRYMSPRIHGMGLLAWVILMVSLPGCVEAPEEEDEEDLGGFLHTPPERVELSDGQMACVELGHYLGAEDAPFWLDCPLPGLEETVDGFRISRDTIDRSVPAGCGEALQHLMDRAHREQRFHIESDIVAGGDSKALLAIEDDAIHLYYHRPGGRSDQEPSQAQGGVTLCANPTSPVDPRPPLVEFRTSIRATPFGRETPQWGITKTVMPQRWELARGGSGVSEYLVAVDVEDVESNYQVVMAIPVENISTFRTAEIARLVIEVDAEEVAEVTTCSGPEGTVEFPAFLRPGEVFFCGFTLEVPTADDLLLGAVFEVTPRSQLPPAVAGRAVSFDDAIFIANEQVTIGDDRRGELGTCTVEDAPCHFSYEESFVCDQDEGRQQNTARIEETSQESQATVEILCEAPKPPKAPPPKTKEELKEKEEDN